MNNDATNAANDAVLKFNQQFEGLQKNQYNRFTKTWYADLSEVIGKTTPILNQLQMTFHCQPAIQDGHAVLVGVLTHIPSGEMKTATLPLPPTDDPQRLTAAITYYRRSLLSCLLNLVADDDDDGNSVRPAQASAMITEDQHATILALVKATNTEESALTNYMKHSMGVEKIGQLTMAQASIIKKMLETKQSQQKAQSDDRAA